MKDWEFQDSLFYLSRVHPLTGATSLHFLLPQKAPSEGASLLGIENSPGLEVVPTQQLKPGFSVWSSFSALVDSPYPSGNQNLAESLWFPPEMA